MGGKSYYCDYCDCFIKNNINVRKDHNIGLLHNIAKANYLAKYKDPEQIVEEEANKIPCTRFANNKYCHYGHYCHYSHYTPEELTYFKWIVDENKNTKEINMTAVGGVSTENMPWKYPKRKHFDNVIPSLQPIDFCKINESCFTQWG